MKPRWMRYRSSKWFELMMLDCAISLVQAYYGPDGARTYDACPLCAAMGWTRDGFAREACSKCPFGPELDGCMRLEQLGRYIYRPASFVAAYGVSWQEAYPEVAQAILDKWKE